MKAEVDWSGNRKGRSGRCAVINIAIEPENELERAVLRMAYSGKRSVNIWESGDAAIEIVMPRGKNS